MRVSRQWAFIKLCKWSGSAYDHCTQEKIPDGGLVIFCPTCPQPGISLLEGWELDEEWCVSLLTFSCCKSSFLNLGKVQISCYPYVWRELQNGASSYEKSPGWCFPFWWERVHGEIYKVQGILVKGPRSSHSMPHFDLSCNVHLIRWLD